MDQAAILAILNLVPGLIWALLGVFVVAKLYHPFRQDILPRLSGVQMFGLKLDIGAEAVQKAVESVPRPGVVYPPTAGSLLVARADRAAEVLRGASIAWVDDRPANNITERRLLSRMGIYAEPVTMAAEVASSLRAAGDLVAWDLVISDASRPADPDAGVERTIARLRADGYEGRVIFYVGSVDPARGIPPGAFGITNRPDELLHLVIDALERSRDPRPA